VKPGYLIRENSDHISCAGFPR